MTCPDCGAPVAIQPNEIKDKDDALCRACYYKKWGW